MKNDEKVKCLMFYINPSWAQHSHKVYVALPEDWTSMEKLDREQLVQEWFEEWRDAQVEDSGWTFSHAYEDELTTI